MNSYIKKYYMVFPADRDSKISSVDYNMPNNSEQVDELMRDFVEQIQIEVEALESQEDNRDHRLWIFVNLLNDNEIGMLLQDILLENTNNLAIIFTSSIWSTISENAFNWLVELPYKTESKILNQIEIIYEKALRGDYPDNNMIIRKIQTITAINKRGLSKEFILKISEYETVDPVHKAKLFLLLSLLEESVGASFWEKNIDLKKEPYLAVAIISKMEEQSPKEALEILKKINDIDWIPNEFLENTLNNHLVTSLQNYLDTLSIRDLNQAEYFLIQLFRSIRKSWIKNILNQVTQDPMLENDYPEIMRKLNDCLKNNHGQAYQFYRDIIENPSRGEMVCEITSNNQEFQREIAQLIYEDFKSNKNKNILKFQNYILCCIRQSRSFFIEIMSHTYGVYITAEGLQDFRTGKRCEFEDEYSLSENRTSNSPEQEQDLTEIVRELCFN